MLTPKALLTSDQIEKLRRVFSANISIYPLAETSTFPILNIGPREFLRLVYLKLQERNIEVSAVRLNGGAASYVLVNDPDFVYRDVDILFCLNTPLTSQRETNLFNPNNEPHLCDVWTIIKYVICSCLMEYMIFPQNLTPKFLSSILDTYAKKNIQINSEQDSWGLLSLQSPFDRNLELKFTQQWKRQWQFSVDSFQIDLLPLLFDDSDCSTQSARSFTKEIPTTNISINAFNALNIRSDIEQSDANTSISIQFGSVTPPIPLIPAEKLLQMEKTSDPRQTLTTITMINSNKKSVKRDNKTRTNRFATNSNLATASSSNETVPVSNGVAVAGKNKTDDDDDDDDEEGSYSTIRRIQLSQNEDIDDGIVVDADESTTEDDESVYQTPPTEVNLSSRQESKQLAIEYFCTYKDLQEALNHLNNKIIATYEPEKLRGGGLLKYCDLLAQKYKAFDDQSMYQMQRYMCSRFFIDFKTLPEQISVIAKYVASHFLPCSRVTDLFETYDIPMIYQILQSTINPSREMDPARKSNCTLCLDFFQRLNLVIYGSCVCLTSNEKEVLIMNLSYLRECYHAEYEYLFQGDHEHQQIYHAHPIHSTMMRYTDPYVSTQNNFELERNFQLNRSSKYSTNRHYSGNRRHTNRYMNSAKQESFNGSGYYYYNNYPHVLATNFHRRKP